MLRRNRYPQCHLTTFGWWTPCRSQRRRRCGVLQTGDKILSTHDPMKDKPCVAVNHVTKCYKHQCGFESRTKNVMPPSTSQQEQVSFSTITSSCLSCQDTLKGQWWTVAIWPKALNLSHTANCLVASTHPIRILGIIIQQILDYDVYMFKIV